MSVVFVSGGTGYLGASTIQTLLARGHRVHALARLQSAKKLPPGCLVVSGNALEAATFQDRVPPGAAFLHLVGTSHPAPWKAAEFRRVDLASVRASVEAARTAQVSHFIYVSVARPAPVMKAYQAVRAECESLIVEARLQATFLRPWYVLGPGHRWPWLLLPLYRFWEARLSTAETARRLGLVTLEQMTGALVWAVENPVPAAQPRIIDVPAIRSIPG